MYRYTMLCLLIHQLISICTVSIFWLLGIMLRTFVYTFCIDVFSIFLNVSLTSSLSYREYYSNTITNTLIWKFIHAWKKSQVLTLWQHKFWFGYVDLLNNSKFRYEWWSNFVLTLNSQVLEAKEQPGMNSVPILIKDFLVEVVLTFWMKLLS